MTITLPEAAIPAGVTVSNLLSGRYADSHFKRQQEPVTAVPTPFASWNRMCRDAGGGVGLAHGWYVLLAGATGHGKSLLALALAAEAIRHGHRVGIVSLEMTSSQTTSRLYATLTGTTIRSIERGRDFDPALASEVAVKVQRAREESGARVYVNNDPLSELGDVLKLAGHYVEEGCQLVIVDYLQLISTGDEREMSREVTRISHSIRLLAKRLNVVVVGLSQFNRSTSANRADSPTVQGLIGSSSLENDADQVLLLDHSRYKRDGDKARTWAILGKNRHGSSGSIPIEWDYRTLSVREAMPDEEHLWPGAKDLRSWTRGGAQPANSSVRRRDGER